MQRLRLTEEAKRAPSGQAAVLSTLEVPLAPFPAVLVLSEVPYIRTIVEPAGSHRGAAGLK